MQDLGKTGQLGLTHWYSGQKNIHGIQTPTGQHTGSTLAQMKAGRIYYCLSTAPWPPTANKFIYLLFAISAYCVYLWICKWDTDHNPWEQTLPTTILSCSLIFFILGQITSFITGPLPLASAQNNGPQNHSLPSAFSHLPPLMVTVDRKDIPGSLTSREDVEITLCWPFP